MKNFVTVFGRTSDVQLTKDVGMIPFVLGKDGYYSTKIASLKMEKNYPSLKNDTKGLNLEFFDKCFNSYWFSELIYIIKNAKEIDILNLYHLNLRSCIQLLAYKVKNKNGYVYLKTDCSYLFFSAKQTYSFFKRKVYTFALKRCDLVTAESKIMVKVLSGYGGRKIEYLPNGCVYKELGKEIQRENIILSVGRLGTKQKNTELLLNAFVKANLGNWKLVLVGEATQDCKDCIDRIKKENPQYMDSIEHIDFISNREALTELYEKSKIFVLPSRWEGFALVMLEALSAGDYLLLSDSIPPSTDIIANSRIGKVFSSENEDELIDTLKQATLSKSLFSKDCVTERKNLARDNYSWEVICKRLYELIEENCNKQ